jgi:hypothetical protein
VTADVNQAIFFPQYPIGLATINNNELTTEQITHTLNFNKEIFHVEDGEYPLNDTNIFWINVPIIWILMPIFAALSYVNLFFGLWIPYFVVFNSLTHVFAAIIKRKYNPGLFVSLILGIPVATYTLWLFYTLINIPLIITVLSLLSVLLLHLAIVITAIRRFKREKRINQIIFFKIIII